MELGNLVIAALVLSQFLGDKPFSLPAFISGIAVTLLIYLISYIIDL